METFRKFVGYLLIVLTVVVCNSCRDEKCANLDWGDFTSWKSSKSSYDDGSVKRVVYVNSDSTKYVFELFYMGGTKQQEIRKIDDVIVYENSYFGNERLEFEYEPICNIEMNFSVFSYSEYYPNGRLKHTGVYGYVKGYHSNYCKDSQQFDIYIDSLVLSSNIFYPDTIEREVMVGCWQNYYSNGKLESVQYYDTIYAYCRELVIADGKRIGWLEENVSVNVGKWEYYNETGELVKEELWDNGRLTNSDEDD